MPRGVDPSEPSAARIYDYLLGGNDNYEADRALAEWLLTIAPDTRTVARSSRQFLLHAVGLAAEAGVRQFIDLGAGLPTSPNVHEIAQSVDSSARVVSVDYDPVVHAYANAYLSDLPGVTPILADIRRPDDIIDQLRSRALIDFDQPVAVLLVSVLHYVMDDEYPAKIIARFRDEMAAGSYLAFTHPTDELDPARIEQVSSSLAGTSAQFVCRSRAELAQYCDGFEPLAPGLAPVQDWLDNQAPPARLVWLSCVCRKP
ncbi:SAM-dependent methyltransferase [Nocardia terpenica]|uniref:SAM-dependent methyltransferase n=2 Tax=Nocardia terpenica TaxID=455432 RepID=A0A6G9ZFZ6_9NOCA|nr:SAM-dependent methyltransferase [Nocardia terpenica]